LRRGMQELTGVFDNLDTMRREAWIEGKKASEWPATWCANGLVTVMPWERKVLEQPWGSYPNPPT